MRTLALCIFAYYLGFGVFCYSLWEHAPLLVFAGYGAMLAAVVIWFYKFVWEDKKK